MYSLSIGWFMSRDRRISGADNGPAYDCAYVVWGPCASWRNLRASAARQPKTANPVTPAARRTAARPLGRPRTALRIAAAEPGARVDRLAALADLEVQLRATAAPGVPGRGQGVPGGDFLTHGFEELVVVAVEAQIPIAVIDDG